jgi:hypothetical protein
LLAQKINNKDFSQSHHHCSLPRLSSHFLHLLNNLTPLNMMARS